MDFNDFTIIVSTTDSPESAQRRERLVQYFDAAGITRYRFDLEPVCEYSPLSKLCSGAYGCGRHFGNILNRTQGENIIFFEDDAVEPPGFIEYLNRYLVRLPEDWGIFVAGHTLLKDAVPAGGDDSGIVSVSYFYGMQCLVIRTGAWRTELVEDIETDRVHKYAIGIDTVLAYWCRAHGVRLYAAAASCVGQSEGYSIIQKKFRPFRGIDPGLLVKSQNRALQYTLDDFTIIVSTTDTPASEQRRERLVQYFANAGITKYEFDTEQVCTVSPLPHLRPGYYGCDRHLANIVRRASQKPIIVFEDDAIVPSDFQERLNHHLSQLPEDWDIFVAGYLHPWNKAVTQYKSKDIMTTTCFAGAQCCVFRPGEWRSKFINAIETHEIYKYDPGAFDRCLAPWGKANGVNVYLGAQSLVGQGDCTSITTRKYHPLMGIDPSLLSKPRIKVLQHMHGELDYFKWSEAVNRKYCERHGYDYVIRRDGKREDRHLHWTRVPLILDELHDCDYLFYLDADAVFYSQELSIEDELLPLLEGRLMLLSSDCGHENLRWHPHLPNVGAILMRNNSRVRDIIAEWDNVTEIAPDTRHTHPWEQRGFWNHIFPKYHSQIVVLPDYYRMGGLYGQFIRHLVARPNKERAVTLRDIYLRLFVRKDIKQPAILSQWQQGEYGFFDFIRGFMYLDQILGGEGEVTPVIPACFGLARAFDWAHSELAGEIDCQYYHTADAEPEIRRYIDDHREKETLRIATNCPPDMSNIAKYVWMLIPKEEYGKPSEAAVQSIITGEYHCIDVRTFCNPDISDDITDERLDLYRQKIKEVMEDYQGLPLVLVTDNINLKSMPGIKHSPGGVARHSNGGMTDEEIVQFFIDLKLISGAKSVTSICDFEQNPTGFSMLTCAVYGIPYRNVRL